MDKPAEVDMPADDLIKRMFQRNSHGAGFALQGWFKVKNPDGTERKKFDVIYSKGYMDVESLLEALSDRDKLKHLRVVVHCRIKTSGETDAYTTHPFPLSTNYGELRSQYGKGKPVLFHNGVFTGLGGVINPKSSDTQDFVAGIAAKLLKDGAHISKISARVAENAASLCRVLILYPDPKHPDFRLGTWVDGTITDGCAGCKFSNEGFKITTYSGSYKPVRPLGSEDYAALYGYGQDDYDDDKWERRYSHGSTVESPWKGKIKHIDEYGCNDGEWASPRDIENHWIKIHTKDRLESLKKTASYIDEQEEVVGGGSTLYYFSNNPNPWIIDEDAMMMYDPEGVDLYQTYQDDLTLMIAEEEDRQYEENVRMFDTWGELEEFLELGPKFGEFGVHTEGKDWYVDQAELMAYTEKGLKLCFKPGEVGHVRNVLYRDGYNSYNGYYSEKAERERKEQDNGDKPESSGETLHTVKGEGTVHGQNGGQLLALPCNVTSSHEVRETIR